jgi:hypothetical protein
MRVLSKQRQLLKDKHFLECPQGLIFTRVQFDTNQSSVAEVNGVMGREYILNTQCIFRVERIDRNVLSSTQQENP